VRLAWRAAVAIAASAIVIPVFVTPATASHSWNGYHWSTGSYPINLDPTNSLSDGFRDTGISTDVNADWNRSSRFANTQRFGANDATTRSDCPYPAGRSYRMCDYNWGATGWAGLAQIHINGNHITDGRVRVNNYYGTSNSYRRHVLCQEVGHVLGLDHQASGNNSCMDDSSAGWDELHPNAHDYEMLERIYDHRHTSLAATAGTGERTLHREVCSNRTVTRLADGTLLVELFLPPPAQ